MSDDRATLERKVEVILREPPDNYPAWVAELIAIVRAATLEEAAMECDRRGGLEQEDCGLNRGTQNYFRARNAIRALKEGK